jgi:hypothetical protein
MTYAQAMQFLDLLKDGYFVPEGVVAEALFMTGDGPLITDLPNPELIEFIRALRVAGQL